MLGHASLEQTSTYLNATLRGMHRSMRAFDLVRGGTVRPDPKPSEAAEESGKPCKILASEGGLRFWHIARAACHQTISL